MKRILFVGTALLFLTFASIAQTAAFNLYIEPFDVPNVGGIQAYAFGQLNGKWLIIGGRLDGLHRRQPFASFDIAGNNNQLLVIDPQTAQKWSAPISSLPVSIQEQLSSTNMEFYQSGNFLYIIGGYGYNSATASRKTFENLTAVDVPAVINAIINAAPFTSYFRQLTDPKFAVTGGHLKKINNTYYLLGGNRFDGNYNPMGNPTYTQVYTNAIKKFNIIDDGTTLSVIDLQTITDPVNLHRRDYNAVPQILPNGSEGIAIFSGVFQPTVDLPYLNSVLVDSVSYTVNNTFQQYYNHYHCANLPIYSAVNNEMHTIFFGGIAQYYDSLGTLVQDNNVPFVKTIARVSRNAQGDMSEFKLPIEMPAYLGASAEFICIENIPQYNNNVIKLDSLMADTTLVGYIYGGINSSAKNIFFINSGTQSTASSQLFKVYIIKNTTTGIDYLNAQSTGTLQIQAYPNPNRGEFSVKFNLAKTGPVKITLYNAAGKMVEEKTLEKLSLGENTYHFKNRNIVYGSTYLLAVETPWEKALQKIIVE